MSSPISIKSLFSDTIVYGTSRIVSTFFGIFLIPIYTRYFTVAEYGIMENLNILHILLINIFGLSLGQAMFRFYSVAESKEEKKNIISSIVFSTIFFGILCIIIGFFYGDWFGEKFIQESRYENFVFILVILILTFLVMQYEVLLSVLQVEFKRRQFIIATLGKTIITLLVTIILVVGYNLGIISVFIGSAFGTLIFLVYLYILKYDELSIKWFEYERAIELLKYAIPFVPAAITLLIMRSSDRYFIGALLPESLYKIGLYTTAEKMMMPLMVLGAAFSIAWTPFAMKVSKQDNAKQVYKNSFKYYIAITSVLLIVCSGFSRILLFVLTTPPYYPSYVFTPLLGLFFILNTSYYISNIGTILSKKVNVLVPISIICACLNLILNYFLIPIYGVFGAAWATVLSYFVLNGLIIYHSEKRYYIGFPYISGTILYAISTFISFLILDHFVVGGLLLVGYISLLFMIKYLDLNIFQKKLKDILKTSIIGN